MPDPPLSPISQLLHTLGITREDLEKRSNQMREFLTAENANSLRVLETANLLKPSSTSIPATALPATSTRTRSRANSFRDATPPVTPIKKESLDNSASLRHFDSMEMVIERQRRQSRKGKKERRERERESQTKTPFSLRPSSPPGEDASPPNKCDPTTQEREKERVSGEDSAGQPVSQVDEGESTQPVTPRRRRSYYREHTELNSDVQSSHGKAGTSGRITATQPPIPCFPFPPYLAYTHLLQPPLVGHAGPSTIPVTPKHKRILAHQQKPAQSPLPPSSPPPASSPITTPHRLHVNLVSSPGPMGPLPDEEEYDKLPFTLPPGPYSSNKPDASYAALVGQAILSSPEHRLTLQEIYDYITIVYPYFKRGEQTWMNSIRHVLSTTVCFRKAIRDRSLGRTQWAIWDEDLECFSGGGFRKQLCKDFMNGSGKDVSRSKGKGKARKRGDLEDGDGHDRKPKRAKKDPPEPLPALTISAHAPLSSHPLFPPTRPTPHHQPYYESCLQVQTLPGDVIFPPIPADVGYARIPITSPIMSSITLASSDEGAPVKSQRTPPVSTPPKMSVVQPSSSTNLGLTPNSRSSLSSPPPATSEVDADLAGLPTDKAGSSKSGLTLSFAEDPNTQPPILDNAEDDNDIVTLEDSFLISVKDWDGSLTGQAEDVFEVTDTAGVRGSTVKQTKGMINSQSRDFARTASFLSVPASPTLKRKAAKPLTSSVNKRARDQERCTSPTPSTPPQTLRQLPTSSIRTPLSSKGVNPAALHSEGDDEEQKDGQHHLNKTPRKRIPSTGIPAPVTPRRLVFPTNQNTSPFRTPGGVFGGSPFRTPGSRGIFDPHDPGALLDEELSRVGATGQGDSPAGLFGKGRGSLLYDSPGLSISPGRWW